MADGYTGQVSRMETESHKTQIALAFAVFFATASLLSSCELGDVASSLHQPLQSTWRSPGLVIGLLIALPAWLAGIALLLRIAGSLAASRQASMTVSVLLLLLGFLGAEALISAVFAHVAWLTGRHNIAEVVSGLVVAGAAPLLLRRSGAGLGISEMEQSRFLAAIEHSLDDFYLFDGVTNDKGELIDFRFRYINQNVERRLRLHRDALLGRLLTEVRPRVKTSGLLDDYKAVVRTGEPYNREIFFDDELIRATWIHVHAIKLDNGLAVTSRDVTDNKRRADHVSYLAHYDQLTGLPNRTLLEDQLAKAIGHAQRQDHKLAVFLVDIDQFKEVNDRFGHAGGDELLIAIARRLRSCMHESDTVARLGGDEFVVVMSDVKTTDEVRACGLKLVEHVARPILIEGQEISVTISVGACIYPDEGVDARQLMKNADTAMYVVKGTGRNGLNLFEQPESNDQVASSDS